MSIGAKDRIDKLLVKKYAQQQVDNHDLTATSMVNPEKMMEAMNDYAAVQRNVMFMSNKISNLCASIKAKARYSPHLQART
ncbi:hypothetical protein J6O48_13330 [bacterium]|nr:hypothetical protein [bacterium]